MPSELHFIRYAEDKGFIGSLEVQTRLRFSAGIFHQSRRLRGGCDKAVVRPSWRPLQCSGLVCQRWTHWLMKSASDRVYHYCLVQLLLFIGSFAILHCYKFMSLANYIFELCWQDNIYSFCFSAIMPALLGLNMVHHFYMSLCFFFVIIMSHPVIFYSHTCIFFLYFCQDLFGFRSLFFFLLFDVYLDLKFCVIDTVGVYFSSCRFKDVTASRGQFRFYLVSLWFNDGVLRKIHTCQSMMERDNGQS